MLFESRSFWHAKSFEFANEYEDAFAVGDHGVAAVADGVSSAIFSRDWAQILTTAVVEQPPDLTDGDGFRTWLAERRSQWSRAIDFTKLDWMKRQKLQQVGGAYCTLLWAEFYPWQDADDAYGENSPARFLMRCFAVGDSCLFHIRDGQLVHKFPLEAVEQFAEDPITICSVNRNRDHLLEFQTLEDVCRAGDFVFLTSDALAKWIYQTLEAEEPVDWEAFWNMTPEQWNRCVAELRDLPTGRRMRVDDTTLVMLRMGGPVELAEESKETGFFLAMPQEEGEQAAPEATELAAVAEGPTETEGPVEVVEATDALDSAELAPVAAPEPVSPDEEEESTVDDEETMDGGRI
jgi:hypothetical protein